MRVSKLIERHILWNCIHRDNRVPKRSEVIRVASEFLIVALDHRAEKFGGVHCSLRQRNSLANPVADQLGDKVYVRHDVGMNSFGPIRLAIRSLRILKMK